MVITTLVAATLAQTAMTDVKLVRWPEIHGDKYVFTYASDLWISDLNGSYARRLTSHAGLESNAKFSPDGKWIAFTGQYDGGNDVYIIPSEGGTPKRITYSIGSELVKEWTPDGKKIAYISSAGNHTNRMPRLWMVSRDGGQPERTPIQEAFDVSFSPDGSKIAFNRAPSHMFNWRRYRGGTQGKISFWDNATGSYSEVPSKREQNYFPMWVGDTVYFISDRNLNNLNLYSYNTQNKRVTQLTSFTDGDIRWPSTDGNKIIFERNLRIHTFNIADGKVDSLSPKVVSDQISMRKRYVNVGNQVSGISLSPSGKRVALEARGEVFSVPATRGTSRNLTQTSGAKETSATWSPDGQWIYYLGDETGETKLYKRPQMGGPSMAIPTQAGDVIGGFEISSKGDKVLYGTNAGVLRIVELATGKITTVHEDPYGSVNGEFSPNGEWVLYSATQPNIQSNVMLYDVKTGNKVKVTSGFYQDNQATFDMTGKYIYLISNRTFSPFPGTFEIGMLQQNNARIYVLPLDASMGNPLERPDDEEPVKATGGEEGGPQGAAAGAQKPASMKVDTENMEARMVPLPLPPSQYFAVIGHNNGVLYFDQTGTMNLFSLAAGRPVPIISGIQSMSMNPSRTKFVYQAGPVVGIANVQPGQQVGVGRVNTSNMDYQVDPAAEYEQMFWEVWRYERDEFYDPDMLGLDWKAIGDKYAKLLPYIGDRSDFDYIIGQLIGELGTGHAYVSNGPSGSDPMSPPAGLLGADYTAVGNKIKFQKIYRGHNYLPGASGPLGALGVDVKDGEFLLAINGKDVTTAMSVDEHLIGKIGEKVTLTVGPNPTKSGSREVVVSPISNETNLRYYTWVDERRAMVNEMSGGRIGYIHVPDTNVSGIIEFIRGYYSQVDKDAWVIDERYNGGGWIPTFFIEYLNREFTNVIAPRHGNDIGLPNGLEGPKAMLINEHAGSGGDLFPYLFKKAGLGPLIGKRTWGGLVGISGSNSLMGGGGVTAPAFGIYDPDTGKWIAENTGVDPDIEIDDRPDLAAQGKDPQLERAVEYLVRELRNKKQKSGRPDHPVVPPYSP